MVSKETQIVAVFVILGIALSYASTTVTESTVVQIAVLIGVGVIAPTLINEWRTNSTT